MKGISCLEKNVLNNFYKLERAQNIFGCWFRIRNGILSTIHDNTKGFDRIRLSLEMINHLYSRSDWNKLGAPENGDFFLSCDDRPPEDENLPILSYSNFLNSKIISIPSCHWFGWPYNGIPSIETWSSEWLSKFDIPFNKRKDVIFWRGCGLGHRLEVIDRLKDHPNADCEPSSPILVPMTNQNNYKYLLDITGVGWSARIVQLTWMGAVLFICDRSYHESWFREYFKPWIHYIPVSENGSDLVEKLENVIKLDDKGASIAKNCRKLAKKLINLDCMDKLLAKKLKEYTKRYGILSK